MKISHFTLGLAMLMLAAIVFTAWHSPFQTEETATAQMSSPDFSLTLPSANFPVNQNAVNEEWKAFRDAANSKIRSNEMLLAEISVQLSKPGTALDTLCVKRIKTLNQENQAFKTRLDAYAKSRSDWESFKRDFNHDMEEFEKALKDMAAVTKK